jgi:hypothetical protein
MTTFEKWMTESAKPRRLSAKTARQYVRHNSAHTEDGHE